MGGVRRPCRRLMAEDAGRAGRGARLVRVLGHRAAQGNPRANPAGKKSGWPHAGGAWLISAAAALPRRGGVYLLIKITIPMLIKNVSLRTTMLLATLCLAAPLRLAAQADANPLLTESPLPLVGVGLGGEA